MLDVSESMKKLLDRAECAGQVVRDAGRDLEVARAMMDEAVLDAIDAGATWVEVGEATGVTPATVGKALRRARARRSGGC